VDQRFTEMVQGSASRPRRQGIGDRGSATGRSVPTRASRLVAGSVQVRVSILLARGSLCGFDL